MSATPSATTDPHQDPVLNPLLEGHGSSHANPAIISEQAKRSLLILLVRYVVGIGIGLTGTILVSRQVGPSIWGIFAIAQVVVLGSYDVLGRGMATYLIKKKEKPSRLDIEVSFSLQHILGLAALIVIGASALPVARWYQQPDLVLLLSAAALAVYGYSWRSIPVALLERDFDYRHIAVLEILEPTVFALIAVTLAYSGHPIAGLSLAILFRSVIPATLAYVYKPVAPKLFVPWHASAELLANADFGSFVAASSILSIAMLAIPALFVGKLAGIESLGILQMAFSLYSNLLFATAAILRINFSKYSRLIEHPQELQEAVGSDLENLATVLVPLIVVFCGLSPVFTPIIFGAKWDGLPLILLAQAPAYFAAAVFWGVLNPALLASGKHRQLLYAQLGMVATYAGASWLLTPRSGALGVALAFSVSQVGLQLVLILMYRRNYGQLALGKPILEMLLGSVSMIGTWWLAHGELPLAVGLLFSYLLFCGVRNRRRLYDLGQALASGTPSLFGLTRRA
jgi:lipopolysaccharide exporter